MALSVNDKGRTIIVTGTTATTEQITAEQCYVTKIVWYDVTTGDHKCSIDDNDGDTIFPLVIDAVTNAGMMTYDFTRPHPINGIHIDDLDSGELYIYLASRESAI